MVQAIVAGIKSKVITKKNAKLFILRLALTACIWPNAHHQKVINNFLLFFKYTRFHEDIEPTSALNFFFEILVV